MPFFTFLKYLLYVGTAALVAMALSVFLTPQNILPSAEAPQARSALGDTPYLESHSRDLVAWMPWGDAAFERARKENKPVLLSSGFAGCRWGYVMQQESFRNAEIAQYINRYFIPVKIDRCERPDVDRFYLKFVQATTGNAGWPLTVVLTPAGHPFFGGTYFPPKDTFNSVGIKTVLEDLRQRWTRHQSLIENSAREMFALLSVQPHDTRRDGDSTARMDDVSALTACLRSFDPQTGGFSHSPQFPQIPLLQFLLDYARDNPETPDSRQGLDVAVFTLNTLAHSAMQDQLEGGFFPFAADRQRNHPRYVKNLATQAQMALLYFQAAQLANDPYLQAVGEETIAYALRELGRGDGLFYSGHCDPVSGQPDAPNTYYLWDEKEVTRLLEADQARAFILHFGLNDRAGAAPLTQEVPLELTARRLGLTAETVRAQLEASVQILRKARARRPQPLRDEKILTSENAMMARALAAAYAHTKNPFYLEQATRTAQAMRAQLYNEKNERLRRLGTDRATPSKIPAQLEDYALCVAAALDLHEATAKGPDSAWLNWAKKLQQTQDGFFWDRAHAGYFCAQAPMLTGFPRMKETMDGEAPCPNALSALNLQRLYRFSGQKAYVERAKQLLDKLAPRQSDPPLAHATWATALRRQDTP